jgi:hypothetical protein
MHIGTTCVKKSGISNHLKNRILIQVLKENLMALEPYSLEEKVGSWIQANYSNFRNKINACSQCEFDYYDIVAPFRRLLNDVCELVTEYNFDLISLLKEIERDVDSMNAYTKHHMIDESDDSSSISTIESESLSVKEETFYTISDYETINEDAESVVSFVNSEFSVEEVDIEEGPKALPIAIADPYCTDQNCSPEMHTYCELKKRIDRLHNGCIEQRMFIQSIRIELENVLDNAREIRYQIREQMEFANNYIVKHSKKNHSS